MDLHRVKAGFARSPGCGREGIDHLADALGVEFAWQRIAFAKGHGCWRDDRPAALARCQRLLRLPAEPDAGLASGMRQLDGSHASLLLGELRDARQRLDL